MRRIIIGNPLTDNTYKTFLAEQYTSGVTLSVLSNVSFQASDLILAQEVGEELAEVKRVASTSGKNTITLSEAFNFSHQKDTPLYVVAWNFVVIEGRSSSAGSFQVLTESAIQWDKRDTIWRHTAGTSSWEYRFRFWNSVTNTYSEYSTTISGAGFSRNQVGFMLDQVRQITRDFDGRVASDAEIIDHFNAAQDIVYGRNPRYWFLLVDTKQQGTGISATANNDTYSLASYSTLGHLASIRYRYNSGSLDETYHLDRKSPVEFDALVRDANRGKEDWPYCYKLLPADSSSDQGYFQVNPVIKTSNVGTFYPNYYEKMADLNSVDDETQIPLPNLLVYYAISQLEMVRGNETKAQIYEDRFWGPADKLLGVKRIYGLALLDEMDNHQKKAWDQPQSLVKFRGQKAVKRLFGDKAIISPDDYRERYF